MYFLYFNTFWTYPKLNKTCSGYLKDSNLLCFNKENIIKLDPLESVKTFKGRYNEPCCAILGNEPSLTGNKSQTIVLQFRKFTPVSVNQRQIPKFGHIIKSV